MIKKIAVELLEPGMFVSDFNAAWLQHPFAFNSRLLANDDEVARVRRAGIRELFIDTERGRDVAGEAPTAAEAAAHIQAEVRRMAEAADQAAPARSELAEEMGRARSSFVEATRLVRSLMEDVRLGQQFALEATRATVEKVTSSVLRNPNAMMTVRRLYRLDDYTFLHSVSVCAMLAGFGKVRDLPLADIHDMALGGLLHDVGKARVAGAILNKPGRLTEDEFTHIKSHVVLGVDLVRQTPGISSGALAAVEFHHERYDGSGYPQGLKGEEVPLVGRMAAIVDVYDAMTSDKVYGKGLSPAQAVHKMFEWSRYHFDPELTQLFLRSIGIYPVGSLVLLESGRLAVVVEQSDSQLLKPRVRVIYDIRHQHYLTPELLDLSRPLGAGGGDRIVGYELPEKYGIDVDRFIHA